MKCSNVKPLIPAFTDNELEDRDYEEINNHFSCCSDCSNELKEWRNIKMIMRDIGSQEIVAPPGLQTAVLSQLKRENTWSEEMPSENLRSKRIPAASVFSFVNKFSTRVKRGIAAAAAIILMGTAAGGLWSQNAVIIANLDSKMKPPVTEQQHQPEQQPETVASKTGTLDTPAETDSVKKDTATLNRDTTEKQPDSKPVSEPINKHQSEVVPDSLSSGQGQVQKEVDTPPKPQSLNPEQHSDVVFIGSDKIIHSGYVKLQAANLTALHETSTTLAGKYGAVFDVQSLGQAESGASREMLKFTVPKDKFSDLYNDLLALGQVVDNGLADDNISERYRQTAAQLLVLKAQKQQPNQTAAQQKETEEKITALEEQLYRWAQATETGSIALWLEGNDS